MRRLVAGGLVATAVLWFGIPALTSHSWLSAGDTATTSSVPVPGNRISGVLTRFFSL